MTDDIGKTIRVAKDKVLDDFDIKIREIKIKEKEKATKEKAASLGVLYINLANLPIPQDALKLIDKKDSDKYKIVCFFYGDRQIRLGTLDFFNPETEKFIKMIKEQFVNKDIVLYLISEYSFKKVFDGYASLPEVKEANRGVQITEKSLQKFGDIKKFKDIAPYLNKVSLTDILNLLLSSAININASDIHIETEEDGVKIRFRIDGMLHDIATLPKEKWKILSSRIKLVSKLKINVDSVPQDGRFGITFNNEKVDVRVSTLPTNYGESIVIRLLMFSKKQITFEEIGLNKENYALLKRGISRPNGMILNTGPTGSGKTTTLYAILQELNKEETKIITIEDPIEYHLKGINQSHVDVKKDYTFAKALRAIVRQDPDVIMVGEIRDIDTAETAIQASLTGHLVLSTVHTNSAAGSVPRLLSMQAKSFLLAPALNTVMAQRLVRRICVHCKKEVRLEKEVLDRVKKLFLISTEEIKKQVSFDNLESQKFYKGEGCDKCGGIGFKGRVAIFELIDFDTDIRAVITKNENVSEDEIQKAAVEKGMVTMGQDGVVKALEGITDIDEVLRVAE